MNEIGTRMKGLIEIAKKEAETTQRELENVWTELEKTLLSDARDVGERIRSGIVGEIARSLKSEVEEEKRRARARNAIAKKFAYTTAGMIALNVILLGAAIWMGRSANQSREKIDNAKSAIAMIDTLLTNRVSFVQETNGLWIEIDPSVSPKKGSDGRVWLLLKRGNAAEAGGDATSSAKAPRGK
jgi:hypothetical protein